MRIQGPDIGWRLSVSLLPNPDREMKLPIQIKQRPFLILLPGLGNGVIHVPDNIRQHHVILTAQQRVRPAYYGFCNVPYDAEDAATWRAPSAEEPVKNVYTALELIALLGCARRIRLISISAGCQMAFALLLRTASTESSMQCDLAAIIAIILIYVKRCSHRHGVGKPFSLSCHIRAMPSASGRRWKRRGNMLPRSMAMYTSI